MDTISYQTSLSPLLSSNEKSKATDYLNCTRDNIIQTVESLDDSQWHFKPAPDRWSIAEILEHVVIGENRVHAILGSMRDAPPAEPGRVNSQIDEFILAEVPRRSAKFQAAPQGQPSHRWTPAETLQHFLASRTRTLELLDEAPFLRGRVVPHPFLGPWDGYQWILAAGAHGARHTDQILEVKGSTGFPALTTRDTGRLSSLPCAT